MPISAIINIDIVIIIITIITISFIICIIIFIISSSHMIVIVIAIISTGFRKRNTRPSEKVGSECSLRPRAPRRH